MDPAAAMRESFELINSGDIDAFVDTLAEDFVEHEAIPGLPADREGTRQLFQMLGAAFPDMTWEPEDILADGDKAVARVRFSGTNDGEFMGMAATGKHVSVQGIDIVRFDEDGRALEHWGVMDQMSMMVQLGAVPAPG